MFAQVFVMNENEHVICAKFNLNKKWWEKILVSCTKIKKNRMTMPFWTKR